MKNNFLLVNITLLSVSCVPVSNNNNDIAMQYLKSIETQEYFQPGLNEYVEQIAEPIRKCLGEVPKLKIRILDTPLLKANVGPEQDFMISRGLLSLLMSEEELAAIFAHEMAHIKLQHPQKLFQTLRNNDLISLPTRVIGIHVNSDEKIKELFHNYSNEHEISADKEAVSALKCSGYSLIGLDSAIRLTSRMDVNQRIRQIKNDSLNINNSGKYYNLLSKKHIQNYLSKINGIAFGNSNKGIIYKEDFCFNVDKNYKFPNLKNFTITQNKQGTIKAWIPKNEKISFSIALNTRTITEPTTNWHCEGGSLHQLSVSCSKTSSTASINIMCSHDNSLDEAKLICDKLKDNFNFVSPEERLHILKPNRLIISEKTNYLSTTDAIKQLPSYIDKIQSIEVNRTDHYGQNSDFFKAIKY